MSNYYLKAKHKKTGKIVEVTAIDYGDSYEYIVDEMQYASKMFIELYEVIEDLNHPYGGLEVEDNVPPETLEDRFNKEFVDEDTGVLNIGKYDHERSLTWIKNEMK